jgi:uncharacterized protein YggE
LKSLHFSIVIIAAIAGTLPVSAEEHPPERSIEVTGIGLVTQSPDLAKITFAVETQDVTAEGANRANAEKTDRVIRALKNLGISSEDLRTQNYSVSPRFRDRSRNERDLKPLGFVVSNALTITIRKLSDLGSAIDRAVEAGATRVNHIRFELSDPEGAREVALKRAMKHARAEALVLLSETPHQLGKVLRIRTQGGHFTPKAERVMISKLRMDTPIEPGTLDIRAQVTVSFEILD